MVSSVLIVDKDAVRRAELSRALLARGLEPREAEDAFSGMASLGRESFSAVVAHAGRRHLSLRGLLQLARRKSADVALWILVAEEDEEEVRRSIGRDAHVLSTGLGLPAIVEHVASGEPPAPLPAPPPTGVAENEEHTEQTEQTEQTDEFEGAFTTPAAAGEWSVGSGMVNDEEAERDPTGSGESPLPPTGAAVLMRAFARERTGRLSFASSEGGCALYLYTGEVAWADPVGGDAALFEALVAHGLLPPDAAPEAVPEGRLLSALVKSGALSREDVYSFMRRVVSDATVRVADAENVELLLEDAPAFLAEPPPFRVNPFALLLEAGRRRRSPDELLFLTRELAAAKLVAGPQLAAVASKIAPFLRGADLGALVEDGATVHSFAQTAGVDDLLATQLVLALEAAELLRVERPVSAEGS